MEETAHLSLNLQPPNRLSKTNHSDRSEISHSIVSQVAISFIALKTNYLRARKGAIRCKSCMATNSQKTLNQ